MKIKCIRSNENMGIIEGNTYLSYGVVTESLHRFGFRFVIFNENKKWIDCPSCFFIPEDETPLVEVLDLKNPY